MSAAQPCVICESRDEHTIEHIIPQALLDAWGLDPNGTETARFRTDLCRPCNFQMAKIHDRPEMMRMIIDGDPITDKALRHFADWIVWVTMLLGVARGRGVWPVAPARDRLLKQFSREARAGATPKGTRVYVARAVYHPLPQGGVSHAVALRDDNRIVLDYRDRPSGISGKSGVINAAECLGIGRLMALVIGPTWDSGPEHKSRLDAIPESAGFLRIQPFPEVAPTLQPMTVDQRSVKRFFTAEALLADDISLLPREVQLAMSMFGRKGA